MGEFRGGRRQNNRGGKPFNRQFGNRSNNNRGNNRYQGRGRYNSSNRNNSRRRSSRPKAQVIDRALYINDQQKEVAVDKRSYTGKPYTDYNLNYRLANNLERKSFELTTEIQEKTIPLILEGKDVLGISPTGSGKTGAFLIPMIEKLLEGDAQRLLVVAPTRELALQIAKEATSLIKGTYLELALIIGGESMRKQLSQLDRGGQVIVGTPGRLNDLIKRGDIEPALYNNIVIDEVDRMLDMGFIDDIRFIFGKLKDEKQVLFFSATHNKKVEKIASSLSHSFDIVKLSQNTPTKSVVQSVIDYSRNEDKIELLQDVLKQTEVKKAIIFVDTKRYADKVDKILHRNNFKVAVIHGDKRQNVRKRVIEMFKNSKINVLVATNVAARGIDIDDITHVINLDEPQTYDEYIHRIGRTGRNGSLGTAYTFVKRK